MDNPLDVHNVHLRRWGNDPSIGLMDRHATPRLAPPYGSARERRESKPTLAEVAPPPPPAAAATPAAAGDSVCGGASAPAAALASIGEAAEPTEAGTRDLLGAGGDALPLPAPEDERRGASPAQSGARKALTAATTGMQALGSSLLSPGRAHSPSLGTKGVSPPRRPPAAGARKPIGGAKSRGSGSHGAGQGRGGGYQRLDESRAHV